MECTSKYYPSSLISCQGHICSLLTTNLSDRGSSTSANELSRQWAVRPSTAHRLEIRRALYLTPSDNKLICGDSGALATLQSTPPMGRTSSTTHRWLFHVKATSATLLTTNLFLVISTNLRPQAHCPERRCTPSTPPSSAISTCWQILVLLTRN